MAYLDTDLPVISNGSNSNSGWGNDGWWGIVLLALLFGNRGFGGGFGGFGGSGGSGSEFVGYELGKVATQADIASGFNNSAVLSSLNDIKLGQSNGFAGVQQTLCQGFNGINTAILQGFHGVDNAVCTLGYNMATGFNGINQTIANCCCDIKSMLMENRYLNERQTCDLITNQNANTQRIVDMYTTDKINALTAENVALKGRISNDAQTAQIVGALKEPCPIPAYFVPNPNCCYNSSALFGGNGCSGCGSNY